MKNFIYLMTVCFSLSAIGQQKEFNDEYFQNKDRVAKIQKNRPTQLECSLVGKTRLKKQFVIDTVTVDLSYDDNNSEVVIDAPPADWGNWAVSTIFPLVDKSATFKIDFEAVRKDVTNVNDDTKEAHDSILVNEKVKMTFETSVDHIEHFVRMGSGVEEMTDWDLYYKESKYASLEGIISTLSVTSKEKRDDRVQTESQQIFQKSSKSWVNSYDGDETFLDAVSDDYMFMFKTNDKKPKFKEISNLGFYCEWDAKDLKI